MTPKIVFTPKYNMGIKNRRKTLISKLLIRVLKNASKRSYDK
jgi:hypothetical protein